MATAVRPRGAQDFTHALRGVPHAIADRFCAPLFACGRRHPSSNSRYASAERDYFFAAGPAPGFSFKNDEDAAAGCGFFALGFFGSRLLLF